MGSTAPRIRHLCGLPFYDWQSYFTFHATCTITCTFFSCTPFLVLAFDFGSKGPIFFLYLHIRLSELFNKHHPRILLTSLLVWTHMCSSARSSFHQSRFATKCHTGGKTFCHVYSFYHCTQHYINCLLTQVWIRSLCTKEGVLISCIYQVF